MSRLTEEQKEDFHKLCDPLIEFLNQFHPHVSISIDGNTARMDEGLIGYTNNDFIRD